ncbi:HYC_CC_PP family protein [Hanstruepera marina]|uniref:HYC_CC_PP family protein n=1 Tax=Hanstruepera marina TaxID=2873265 RepID=UPI0038B3C186
MMKDIVHRVFSVGMALLVLFSTVSFTVEKHYCGDVLVDVSLFAEVQKCAMEAYEMEQSSITKKSCCKDTIDVVQGQDELTVKTFDDLEFEQQVFLTTFSYSYLNLFEDLQEREISHQDYSPPNLVYDIQVRDQAFLI